MRKLIAAILCIGLLSCHGDDSEPEMSHIQVQLSTFRFDQALFALDSASMKIHLDSLVSLDPSFGENFISLILNADPSWKEDSVYAYVGGFVQAYHNLYDSSQLLFEDFSAYEDEIRAGLRRMRYYFPTYSTPERIITYIGPLDGYGDILTEESLLIGLHQHLGAASSYYQSEYLRETYPEYLCQRFSPDYISVNAMKNLINDMLPEPKDEGTLLTQMIDRGRKLYVLQRLLPKKEEYFLLGYTAGQMQACYREERRIWDMFLKNAVLQSTDYSVNRTYVGESPRTQELGTDAPGNIGSFTGWQIVKAYMKKNPKVAPDSLLRISPDIIMEQSKYKP